MCTLKKTGLPALLKEKLLNGRAPPGPNLQVKRCPDSRYMRSYPDYNGSTCIE